MNRLLICLNKRELFDAKSKKCLEKLSETIVSLISDGHILAILPIININAMRLDLENYFLFEKELATIIIKNSMLFFDSHGKFSNPLFHVPQVMKELKIHSKHVIVVDTHATRLEEANNYGYASLMVPNLESPVYDRYIDKLSGLAKILYKS